MADKPSLNETKAFLAAELKKTLAEHTARIEEITSREAKAAARRASKLAKAEKKCKSCGKMFDSVGPRESEYCGSCNRKPKDAEGKVRKNDLMTTPDSGAPTSMGMSEKSMRKDAMAGQAPGGGDMTLSEKSMMCSEHGGKHPMGKCDMDDVRPGKDVAKREEYAARAKAELEKGDAWMDGVKRGKSVKKDEKGAAASVATANKELGGFKSLATNPTAPFKTKPGTAPTGKMEKKSPPGKFHDLPEKLAREGKSKSSAEAIAWSAYDKSKGKTEKAELPAVKAAPAKKTPGAKLPGAGKKVDATGSGGQVEKGKSMKKAAIDVALGMQKPVPADPMAHTKLKLPGMKQTPAQPPPVPKVNGMHPVTAAGLHAVGQGMHPETRASLGALPRPSAVSQGGVGVPGKQPAGMGGGDAHKIAAVPPPVPAAARKDEADMQHGFSRPTDMQGRKHPIDAGGWPAGTESWADRSPAMKAAAKTKAAPAPAAGTPVRQQRSPYAGVRGMAALARGEKNPGEKVPAKKGVLAVKPTKLQRGLSMLNHNRRLA